MNLSNMSVQADHSPSLLELPSTCLAHLVQHVASGPGGLASAAAFSRTCKYFYALSESSAVTYRNLHFGKPVKSLGHRFWPWLAKREGRIAGLTADVRLLRVGGLGPEQLQVLFRIPGLHLTIHYDSEATAPLEAFVTKVLRPHGHLIDHLIAPVRIKEEELTLQDFGEAAAACRSLDLTARQYSEEPFDVGALDPVAGSLVRLNLASPGSLFSNSSLRKLSSFSRLSLLSLKHVALEAQDSWLLMAQLTNLKQLSLQIAASGDPSPLSALSGLSSLEIGSYDVVQEGLIIRHTFSSLQPLSTLQQLEELELYAKACTATSLHGLAELSRLERLRLEGPMLKSLEGLSMGLTVLGILKAPQLVSLAGFEHLQGLQKLALFDCGVSSFQLLAALGSLGDLSLSSGTLTSLVGLEGNLCTCLQSLRLSFCRELKQLSGIEGLTALQRVEIFYCGVTSLQPVGQLVEGLQKLRVTDCRSVQEEVLELPHIQPTPDVNIQHSNVKEVVLAGGVRRTVDVRINLLARQRSWRIRRERGRGGRG